MTLFSSLAEVGAQPWRAQDMVMQGFAPAPADSLPCPSPRLDPERLIDRPDPLPLESGDPVCVDRILSALPINGMSNRARTERVLRTLVVAVLLLIILVFVGRKAYKLVVAYHDFNAVEQRLPDLPTVRSGTQQRQTAFPVVWLQRVDGVERAVLMAHKYKGMEIDVVYDEAADYFDVGHPPVPSQGISLDTMFSSVPRVREHYFWIDFKNLTDANKEAACTRLLSIGRKYGIVNQMIVESSSPRALSCFTESGFYTSYYLFPESKLSTMGPVQLTDYYEEVKTNLMASKVNALSSSYRSLPFIRKYFPDTDILTWYAEPGKGLRYYASLAYLRLRFRVKVILVDQRGPGYR